MVSEVSAHNENKKEQKTHAASWLVATRLVKSWVAIVAEKKAPAASWLAATGLVKSMGGHFHKKKKSACGKLDSSNGACQVLVGHFHR